MKKRVNERRIAREKHSETKKKNFPVETEPNGLWQRLRAWPFLLIIIAIIIVAVLVLANQCSSKESHNTSFAAKADFWPQGQDAGIPCDYLLVNATIVDGSGGASYKGNIAVKDDLIVGVGDFIASFDAYIIDASDLIVAPGFIDIHTHSDDYWPSGGDGSPILSQGITTHIVGNCGNAPADIAAYLKQVDYGAINVGTFVGYKVLCEKRGPTPEGQAVSAEALKLMQQQLKKGLTEGAFGISLGLSYYPQNQGTFAEFVALAETCKEADALMAIHIRDEGDQVVESLEEALKVAEKTGVSLQYSHVKAAGKANWSKQDRVLELFDQAIASGLDVAGDAYVYTFSSNDLGGSNESISAENIKKVLSNDHVMLASDGGLNDQGKAIHPRAYANSTMFLISYVREQQLLSLEEAVYKMTYLPAQRMKIPNRGLLKVGNKADLVVFKLEDLKVNATRGNPSQLSEGMSYVFVNGKMVIEKGNFAGVKAGRALKFSL